MSRTAWALVCLLSLRLSAGGARGEPAPRAPLPRAVTGQVWVNLGPGSGGIVYNGLQYPEVDSGRVRRIVPHPTDASVLYVATSGGGVWKSFDALTPIGPASGPRWTPITDASSTSLAVGSLALHPLNPESLVLGLGDPWDVQAPGVVTSDDGGATWQGPTPLATTAAGGAVAGSVRDLVFNGAGNGTILAATDVGLFRSIQAGLGATWQYVDLLPTHEALSCWSLGWVGGTTWLLTCQGVSGGRLFRSTDDGLGWVDVTAHLSSPNETAIPGFERMTVATAAIDAASPGTARAYLVAASTRANGVPVQKDVYKSVDGGQTWTSLRMYAQDLALLPVVQAPRNPTADQPDCDVLHDQARTVQAIQVDPRDRDTVFLGGDLSVLRTTNGGATWDVIADWMPYAATITGQYNLPYVHGGARAMAVSTATTTSAGQSAFARLYLGTEGGLSVSEDRPLAQACAPGAWIHCSAFRAPAGYKGTSVPPGSAVTPIPSPTFLSGINRGLVTQLANSIATDERDASHSVVIGGLQGDGTRLRAGGAGVDGTVFDQVLGGDGFGVGLGVSNDPSAPDSCRGKVGSLLLGTTRTMVHRSIDCGASFAPAMIGIGTCTRNPTSGAPGANPCGLDPRNNPAMRIATDFGDPSGATFLTAINGADGPSDVLRTTNGAASWAKITGVVHLANGATSTQFPAPLLFVGAHPRTASPSSSYLAVDDGHVYATLDGGANWSQSAALPLGRLGAAAFAPGDASRRTLWAVSRSAASGAHVFQSTDLGRTWAPASGSGAGALPGVAANAVKVDPLDPATVYVGTDQGFFRTTSGGAAWSRFGRGLPPVSVTEISVTLDGSAVRIATFGRGFWEIGTGGAVPSGVWGNGDLDGDQVVDGVDLVLLATELWSTLSDPAYLAAGNLTGPGNLIDGADVAALVAKLGGRP